MKYFIGIKATFKNIFFVSLSLIFILWLSVFLYGTFYYLYIPAVAHTRPVYLQFDTSCKKGICGFLNARVTLPKLGQNKLLTRGQPYHIVLDLEMPESEVNQKLGMFMVKIRMLSDDEGRLRESFRSALLVYKSPIIRSIYTFLVSPFLLSGTSQEKQILSISLFENYEEKYDKPTYEAIVEIHSLQIEIYSATLRIHADFSGLRYLMYYWPSLSATVGILTNFYFLAMIALFSWFRLLKWRTQKAEESSILSKKTNTEDKSCYTTPIPLNLTRDVALTLDKKTESHISSSSQAFDILKRLAARSPEKKDAVAQATISSTKTSENEESFNVPGSNRVRLLDIESNQTMTPITEEGSLDSTPISESDDTLSDSTLRKRIVTTQVL